MSVSVSAPSVHTLPILRLSTVSDQPAANASPVDYQVRGHHVHYWRAFPDPQRLPWEAFRQFPLVLQADGSPWVPACLWLLDRARAQPLKLTSLPPLAQGLRDYLKFLHQYALAWDDFSAVDKYLRPTYLYKTHLQTLINQGYVKPSTAGRRMSAVIGLYRFLMGHSHMAFRPLNPPWQERQFGLQFRDRQGFKQVLTVTTTDVSIRVPKRNDAWGPTIADGGQLRPLPVAEQQALVASLKALDHREYELMHYVALLTGAREQTVLTLRWGHFQTSPGSICAWPLKLPCGPGTGIDTKNNVGRVHLVIPRELYTWLHVYAISPRARARRDKSERRQDPMNYLFLSNQGGPHYASKEDRLANLAAEILRRSSPTGQNLRAFIVGQVIPHVRRTLPNFSYRFHDLRATFGVNWVLHATRSQSSCPHELWAREQLRKLMWHRRPATTDRYLRYHEHHDQLEKAQADWGRTLIDLIVAD